MTSLTNSTEGEVTLLCTVENETDTQVHIKVTVKDSGIGIKPEDITKLFVPFSQVSLVAF